MANDFACDVARAVRLAFDLFFVLLCANALYQCGLFGESPSRYGKTHTHVRAATKIGSLKVRIYVATENNRLDASGGPHGH